MQPQMLFVQMVSPNVLMELHVVNLVVEGGVVVLFHKLCVALMEYTAVPPVTHVVLVHVPNQMISWL